MRNRRIGTGFVAALMVALVALSGCSGSNDSTSDQPAGAPSGVSFGPDARTPNTAFTVEGANLGIHSFSTKPEMPTGSIRFNCWPLWSEVNLAEGQYDWTRFDQLVAQAESWGYQDIVYVFCGTPEWAAGGKTSKASVFGPYGASPPKNLDDWDEYVRAVAERYQGRITAYETWNEATSPQFWKGSPAKMAVMTERAFQVIREVDPAAIVTTASMQTHSEAYYDAFVPKYLSKLKERNWPFDVVSAHFYPAGEVGPPKRVEQIEKVQAELSKVSVPDNRPLWDTEVNYNVGQPDNSNPAGRVTGDRAAAWTIQTFLDSWWTGIRQTYWYVWASGYDNFSGIQTRVGDPATAAINTFGGWVLGYKFTGCEDDDDARRCEFEGEDGKDFEIVWATNGKSADVKIRGEKEACPVYGGECQKVRGSAEVTEVPTRIS